MLPLAQNSHCLSRVIQRGIKIGQVVSLRVNGQAKLVTHSDFQTQLSSYFPTVCAERFELCETEETKRIKCLLTIRAKVSEQGVRKRVV